MAFAGLGWLPKEGGGRAPLPLGAATGLASVAALHFLHSWSFKLRLWRWTRVRGTYGDGVFQCLHRPLCSRACNFRGLLLNPQLGYGVIPSGYVFLFIFRSTARLSDRAGLALTAFCHKKCTAEGKKKIIRQPLLFITDHKVRGGVHSA